MTARNVVAQLLEDDDDLSVKDFSPARYVILYISPTHAVSWLCDSRIIGWTSDRERATRMTKSDADARLACMLHAPRWKELSKHPNFEMSVEPVPFTESVEDEINVKDFAPKKYVVRYVSSHGDVSWSIGNYDGWTSHLNQADRLTLDQAEARRTKLLQKPSWKNWAKAFNFKMTIEPVPFTESMEDDELNMKDFAEGKYVLKYTTPDRAYLVQWFVNDQQGWTSDLGRATAFFKPDAIKRLEVFKKKTHYYSDDEFPITIEPAPIG